MIVLTRSDWGSTLPPGGNPITGALAEVYVHHFNSGILPVRDVASGKARMRGAQQHHAVTNGWADIGYSWCVDDVGNIYEGRGWWLTGAHTEGHNSKGYGICWLGDSYTSTPSQAALEAIAEVVRMGQAIGAVVASPTIVAHRDRASSDCCGDPMYAQLDEIRRLAAAPSPGFGNQQLTQGEDDMPSLLCKVNESVFGCFGGYWLNLSGPEWTAWKDKVQWVKHTDAEWATLKQWGRVK